MEILRIGNKFFNAYLIPTALKTWCLVDTGSKGQFRAFSEQLGKHNIDPCDIKYIIVTHAHADHVGFLKEALTVTGAKLIVPFEIADRLDTGKNDGETRISSRIAQISSRITAVFVEKFHCYPPVLPSSYLTPSENPLMKAGIHLLTLSGHTDCDVCVRYNDKLICGDIFSNLSPLMHLMPFWVKDKNALLESWQTLSEIPNIKTVYCGHGKPFSPQKIAKAIEYWKYRSTFPF